MIASVGEEEIGGEKHLVVYFRGKQKALILNKTNASYLAAAIADETDDWPGHEIVLYPTKVNFQGKMVDAIRIEMPAPNGAPKVQAAAECVCSGEGGRCSRSPTRRTSARPMEKELDDEIPF